jgi:threonine synthase
MSNFSGFKCLECARLFGVTEAQYVCPVCSGNLDVLYDYENIGNQISRASLAADPDLTIWRYRALLPIQEASPLPPLTVGWTPIYDCPRLADTYGVKQLLVKDEGRNPTASFKDRPGALAVVKAWEAGARVVTTASSGNAGCALAAMCASVGMRSVVFVPSSAPPPKIAQLQIYGAQVVLVEGSYDEAFDLCLAAGSHYGWYQRSTGYNPFMAEGKKTAALELAEQMNWNVPDRVFVGVGDGNIIGGLWKGFNDLSRLHLIDHLPKMMGVQAEGAAAVVDAVAGDGIVRQRPAHTIADSINVARPRDATRAIRAIQESGGSGIKVSDDEIIRSIAKVARSTGVFVEPAAAAAFAGFVKHSESGNFDPQERVLLMLTGHGLKDTQAARRAVSEPLRIGPDIETGISALADFAQ